MNRLSVALLSALALSSVVAADQGRTEIGPTNSFPIVIDTPGSYVLTTDLHMTSGGTGTAMIEINTDNVTIDLGGHVLRGPGAQSNGRAIMGWDRSGITIHNGTMTELSTGVLMFQDDVLGVNRFHDLSFSHFGHGPALGFSGGVAHDIVVSDVSATALVEAGVSCSSCSLRNVIVSSSYRGISVTGGSVLNCTVVENELGFQLRSASLTGGAAIDNAGSGVHAKYRSAVVGVTVSDNGGWGIRLDSGGGNNVVNCTGGNNAAGNVSGCGDGNGCHQNYLP